MQIGQDYNLGIKGLGNLDSYQFSFAQNAQNIFRLLCKPIAYGCSQKKILNQLFATCMVPACPGWVNINCYNPNDENASTMITQKFI
jgi:hypothetical protein